MGSVSAWEAIFMLVVLKIPMIYLAVVVWWAIRAEPAPGDGAEAADAFVPLTPCGWGESRGPRPGLRPRPLPHGARPRPVLRASRTRTAA
jgi:hypothetical protein